MSIKEINQYFFMALLIVMSNYNHKHEFYFIIWYKCLLISMSDNIVLLTIKLMCLKINTD